MPHILVAEDEDILRSLICDALEEVGYKVFQAADGQQGIKMLKRHPEIDLLLSDIKMPVMGGFALAEEAVRQNQKIKILMLTGYTERKLPDALAGHDIEVWQKPISIDPAVPAGGFHACQGLTTPKTCISILAQPNCRKSLSEKAGVNFCRRAMAENRPNSLTFCVGAPHPR